MQTSSFYPGHSGVPFTQPAQGDFARLNFSHWMPSPESDPPQRTTGFFAHIARVPGPSSELKRKREEESDEEPVKKMPRTIRGLLGHPLEEPVVQQPLPALSSETEEPLQQMSEDASPLADFDWDWNPFLLGEEWSDLPLPELDAPMELEPREFSSTSSSPADPFEMAPPPSSLTELNHPQMPRTSREFLGLPLEEPSVQRPLSSETEDQLQQMSEDAAALADFDGELDPFFLGEEGSDLPLPEIDVPIEFEPRGISEVRSSPADDHSEMAPPPSSLTSLYDLESDVAAHLDFYRDTFPETSVAPLPIPSEQEILTYGQTALYQQRLSEIFKGVVLESVERTQRFETHMAEVHQRMLQLQEENLKLRHLSS